MTIGCAFFLLHDSNMKIATNALTWLIAVISFEYCFFLVVVLIVHSGISVVSLSHFFFGVCVRVGVHVQLLRCLLTVASTLSSSWLVCPGASLLGQVMFLFVCVGMCISLHLFHQALWQKRVVF